MTEAFLGSLGVPQWTNNLTPIARIAFRYPGGPRFLSLHETLLQILYSSGQMATQFHHAYSPWTTEAGCRLALGLPCRLRSLAAPIPPQHPDLGRVPFEHSSSRPS